MRCYAFVIQANKLLDHEVVVAQQALLFSFAWLFFAIPHLDSANIPDT